MRKKNALIITDSEILSKAISLYLEYTGNFETYYFTFENSDLMSAEIYREADIFVIELMRCYKGGRIRAEGVIIAEGFLKKKRKFILVNADVLCRKINSPLYWDIDCRKTMVEKVNIVLNSEFDLEVEYMKIKNYFKDFLSPPNTHHH